MKRSRSRGFTYLALLIAVAITAGALAAAGGVYSHVAQREKERELLFVGEQFRYAIALYYWRTPGGAHQYPKSLEALLEDQRWPTTQRYLRKLYRDPLTGSADWGIVEAPGGMFEQNLHGIVHRQLLSERPVGGCLKGRKSIWRAGLRVIQPAIAGWPLPPYAPFIRLRISHRSFHHLITDGQHSEISDFVKFA